MEQKGLSAEEMSRAKDRARGSVIGAFTGDAAGAVLEFMSLKEVQERVPEALKFEGGGEMNMGPGQITDDSEMAMCILHALTPGDSEKSTVKADLMKRKKEEWEYLNIRKLQEYFHKWAFISDPFDIGNTTT